MKLSLLISLIIVSILSSGCTPKEPKIIYKKAPVYDFQSIDFEGAYIDLKPNEMICKPIILHVIEVYSETKAFYDEQIKDYKKISKEKSKK